MWKEDTKLKQAVQHARDGLSKQERDLYAAMDRNTSAGLKAVARIAEEQQLEGVYGPLYSLFTVTDFYRQAAEVTAGNR
jgi:structural maintenance of chromosome 3 (chondroitin sulfate proteoglycan 6)